MNRQILLEWPDLQLSAVAELADDKNPELCDDLWNALPLCSIMNNAAITDGSMYCWLPLLSFAPIHFKERIDQAPVGRLRYSQATGNKLIVQYSQCYEDVNGTVLGAVIPEHVDIIKQVGEKARESIFMTKQELHIKVSRLDGSGGAPAKPQGVRPVPCRPEVSDLVDRILEKALEATRAEPEENKLARTGRVSGVGSCGQYFSTWEFVYSLTRDLSMYTLYPISHMCRTTQLDVRQLESVYAELEPGYTSVLGSYGLRQLRAFSQEIRALFARQVVTREEFQCIVDAFTLYTNQVAAWAYFYYPWGIGTACFRFAEEYKEYQF